MKITTLILLFIYSINFNLLSQSPLVDNTWNLVWMDDFNGSLNDNIWLIRDKADHYSAENPEPQIYLQNNISFDNQNLIITMKYENYTCVYPYINEWWCNRQSKLGIGYNYTSGWIESKNSYRPKYGYIEAKIKCPIGYGFWPAFWTNSDWPNKQGANYQEIDIFEMIPGSKEKGLSEGFLSSDFIHNVNVMTNNIHYNYTPGTNGSSGVFDGELRLYSINDYSNWHKYGIEWSPSKIIYYVDDIIYRIQKNDGMIDPTRIILNFALNPNFQYFANQFPAKMYVDYVKYYTLNNQCYTSINQCSYDFDNHTNTVKKDYILGGSSCVNQVPINKKFIFRASNEIILNKNFEIPVGCDLYFDVNTCY